MSAARSTHADKKMRAAEKRANYWKRRKKKEKKEGNKSARKREEDRNKSDESGNTQFGQRTKKKLVHSKRRRTALKELRMPNVWAATRTHRCVYIERHACTHVHINTYI
eukprot:NODE_3117_length_704_cov_172.929771_g2207_i0.p4 GENE.NODE_3117_length_704_cov_172.929771_g2207_i0~~NODE_3117_length_704_cov_172.929771_g2207_i0.p4  ORF type:complete len:109 (-),score=6.26 NODE_3117_length_704_cov_172.929771_g2207_i0:263-589(-)